ncbi:hypothetical protein ACJX0J_022566, partial [Zea mays]
AGYLGKSQIRFQLQDWQAVAVRIAASFGSKPHGLLHVATPLQLSRYLRDCSK